MRRYKLFIFFLFCTGCGYHWGYSYDAFLGSISIPFVEGDKNGFFTEELIKQITVVDCLEYQADGGRYVLDIKLGNICKEQIGYRRDVNGQNNFKKNVLPTEGRSSLLAVVSVVDSISQKVLWGPEEISADFDFDYLTQDTVQDLSFINSSGKRESVLWFSLGQLEPISSAQEAAKAPLYRRLAQKIVVALQGISFDEKK